MRIKKLVGVDLFCGGGGTSTGLITACNRLGIPQERIDLTAVNHWKTALETHSANHPYARHIPHRIDQVRPEDVVPGGRADFLWASPECTHHSRARGAKPVNDQKRAQAHLVLDWADRLNPSLIGIENVPEFVEWGPTYASGPNAGKPIPSKKGECFKAWLQMLTALNYNFQWQILNCADYGDATTRQRFFLLARRGNKRVHWPTPSHAQNPGLDLFSGASQSWRPARDIIDWSIPGHSIFLRQEDVKASGLRIKRPLVENT
ncbi:MAG: DNA cytosine methyltransferase, partial [Planctomycetes bacterium]|nr:DNA cytosine methyltransferase [Planctomycetota bacterium]